MTIQRITPEELWSRQQISSLDTDYKLWDKKRTSIQAFFPNKPKLYLHCRCIQKRYDFASDHFTDLFGYNSKQIKTIRKQGNLLEERIHPDDRAQLPAFQIEHGLFIYSLPQRRKERLSTGISNSYAECTATICKCHQSPPGRPKGQERQDLLSKEIAYKLHLSIYTVNNHRKHILSKPREYGNGFDLQGFHLRCQLFREPLQSTPKPNQDGATLLVRNHAQ